MLCHVMNFFTCSHCVRKQHSAHGPEQCSSRHPRNDLPEPRKSAHPASYRLLKATTALRRSSCKHELDNRGGRVDTRQKVADPQASIPRHNDPALHGSDTETTSTIVPQPQLAGTLVNRLTDQTNRSEIQAHANHHIEFNRNSKKQVSR